MLRNILGLELRCVRTRFNSDEYICMGPDEEELEEYEISPRAQEVAEVQCSRSDNRTRNEWIQRMNKRYNAKKGKISSRG